MTNKLGSVYRRKKRLPNGRLVTLPTYWLKYRDNGRVFRESARTTSYQEAKRKLRKRLAEIEDGTFSGPRADKLKIDELLDDLLLDYQVNGKSYKDFAEPIVRLRLRPHFGWLRARDLTTPKVENYILLRRDEGATNGQINRETALLKRAFNLGRKQTPPKVKLVPYIPKLKENNIRKGFLDYEQYIALLAALPDEIRPVLTFAFHTGCRRGEILSLKWTQIDLLRRTVYLEPGTTKNDEARQFFMTRDLYEVLAMQKAVRDQKYPNCPWVFFRDGKPIRDFRGAWESACKAAGLVDEAGKPTRIFHDLRRTGVRNNMRSGQSEAVAMRISGHKTRSVFDRYNIIDERDLQDAARRLDEYLERLKKDHAAAAKKAESGETSGTLLGTPGENGDGSGEVCKRKLLN